MIYQNQAIFDAALALPEGERALLAERLLETLSPDSVEAADDDLAFELDKRFAEFQRDPSVAATWPEASGEK